MRGPAAPPRVTVLMPVFNGAAHLGAALRSILAQSWTDLELLVVDDGSTDDSLAIVGAAADPRVRLVRLEGHQGIVAALNRGLAAARAPLIARMDADDISLPTRLDRQVAFLDAHPDIGVCGTWTWRFGGPSAGWHRPPAAPDQVAAALAFNNPLVHPSVMLRAELVRTGGLCYDPAYRDAEDFELWTRAALVTRLANVPEVLLGYRVHARQLSETRQATQRATRQRLQARQLRRLLPQATEAEVGFHLRWLDGNTPLSPDDLAQASGWARALVRANGRRGVFPSAAFREATKVMVRARFRTAVSDRAAALRACARHPGLVLPLAAAKAHGVATLVRRRVRTLTGRPGVRAPETGPP